MTHWGLLSVLTCVYAAAIRAGKDPWGSEAIPWCFHPESWGAGAIPVAISIRNRGGVGNRGSDGNRGIGGVA
jgi:hypothetical protein